MSDGSLIVRPEQREAVQTIFDNAAADALNIGDTVQVEQGKHHGKEGVIFWQGKNTYLREYGNDFHLVLKDIAKRYGWRAGIKTQDGEKFFVDANYIAV